MRQTKEPQFASETARRSAARDLRPVDLWQRCLTLILSVSLIIGTAPPGPLLAGRPPAKAAPPAPAAKSPAAPPQETPEQLQQLVAPIALYPDPLVAQILAASTYPTEIVEAERWLKQHPHLKGDQLGKAVNQQPWDASVKALTAFPSVIENMNRNLSWTSELGDAYYNQQQDVINAIQTMRQKAKAAGTLTSNSQQKVTTEGQTIVVEPANPEVVYVPAYDPWTVYGAPFGVFPGYYYAPPVGVVLGAAGIGFGLGIPIGLFGGWGWGWHNWGVDWGHRDVMFNRAAYVSHSPTVIDRNVSSRNIRSEFNRSTAVDHRAARGFGEAHAARGFAEPHRETRMHSGAFSGFDHGGYTRLASSRGSHSFHGGFRAGGFHGGGFHGGGFHGGGGHGGGGHR
jgi:Protein of unknown function (DUF3300)